MTELYESPSARRGEPVPVEEDVTSFAGAIGWTIAGTILPGVGLLRARRQFEGITTLVFFLAVVGGAGYLVNERTFLAKLMTSHITLIGLAILCAMLALIITGIIIATYFALRPHVITTGERIGGAVLVLVLSLFACLPLAVGAGYSMSLAGLVR